VVPKVVVMAVASAASFALGAATAWIATTVLIDAVPATAMLAGTLYWALYLLFAVSMVALAAGVSRSVVGAAGLTAVALLVLPIVAQVVPAVRPWVPSALVGSLVELVDGAPAADFVRAAVVALACSAAALWGSVRLLARREV
jgi:hypothetical protein